MVAQGCSAIGSVGSIWALDATISAISTLSETATARKMAVFDLCGEKESPKYEQAGLRWLERYLTESSPTLKNFAEVTHALAEREP